MQDSAGKMPKFEQPALVSNGDHENSAHISSHSASSPASAFPAFADGEFDKLITPADRQRMDKYGETRKEALAEAKAGGAADDLATLDAAVSKRAAILVRLRHDRQLAMPHHQGRRHLAAGRL